MRSIQIRTDVERTRLVRHQFFDVSTNIQGIMCAVLRVMAEDCFEYFNWARMLLRSFLRVASEVGIAPLIFKCSVLPLSLFRPLPFGKL